MLLTLYLTLTLITSTISERGCVHFDANLSQKIENEGYHRNISWLLDYSYSNNDGHKCRLCLHLSVPNGLYVDPDEIAGLMRVSDLSVYVDGVVDVEKPEHRASEHDVFVYISDKAKPPHYLSIPIHLRYHRAQITGGYNRVTLPKPSILAYCEEGDICSSSNRVQAACDHHESDVCIWRNLTYSGVPQEVEMLIPIGDLDDYAFVSVITLFLGCSGCIYILSLLSSSRL